MTDSDTRTETWKTIPGFSAYKAAREPVTVDGIEDALYAAREGQILSVRKGFIMRTRPNNSGYPQVNVTDDEGHVRTRTVHSLVLLTYAGSCPDGLEARHLDGDPNNNRWAPGNEEESRAAGGNLIWGTHSENELDKAPRPRRPPKPPKACILCNASFTGNGRRCHECVVEIGKQAEALLRNGMSLEAAAAQLDYPSEPGLYNLAVKHGGYVPPRRLRLLRVFVTLRDRLRRGR